MVQQFTLYDWFQLLFLFAGMPFTAAAGAATGLLGRIRLGGFLPATIAGLAGAAIASSCLYLGIWTLCLESRINPSVFLEVYESGYQHQITLACLISSFLIAMLFSIAWRLKAALRPPARVAISLRNLLLIQFLSLLCVGSWCGLRLLVFESADQSAIDERLWASRDWTLSNGDTLAVNCLSLTPSQADVAMSRENLREVYKFPKISNINIAGCKLSRVDITPLALAGNLRRITFSDCDINSPNRADLLQLQQLSSVHLQELTTLQPTLSNLARLPKLAEFKASHVRVQREDFKRFLAESRLESISLENVEILQDGEPIRAWPATTRVLKIQGCNLSADDLKSIGDLRSLSDLHLGDSPVNDSVLESFAQQGPVSNVSLTNKNITARGFKILTRNIQPQSLHLTGGTLPLGVAAALSQTQSLQNLHLTGVILSPQDIGELSESTSIVDLRITSPGLSDRTLLMLAAIPTLQRLHYPSFKGCRTFESFFASERYRRKLPQARLVINNTIDAKGIVTMTLP